MTIDNGGMFNRGGQDAFKAGHKVNGELLGFKFGVWEGGHRVPFIARWPGKIKPGTTSTQLISGIDMLATFAALTEQTIDQKQMADSINILPALLDDPAAPLRETLVLSPNKPTHLSYRKGQWMYIPAKGSGGFRGGPGTHGAGGPKSVSFVGSVNSDIENGKIKMDAPAAQLYDLEKDPAQTTNVIREYPEVAQEMKTALTRMRGKAPAPATKKRSRKAPAVKKEKSNE